MKKHHHMKATREYAKGNCFTGHIESEEVYERVKNGEIGWKPHLTKQIGYYRIPAVVFERLLELDRHTSGVTGEWIDQDGKTYCSLCDKSNKQYKPPFCPHCGAPMKDSSKE